MNRMPPSVSSRVKYCFHLIGLPLCSIGNVWCMSRKPHGFVFLQISAVVRRMIQRVIHQPAAEESEPVGISHRVGMLMVGRPHVPFADTTGDVALILHEVSDGLDVCRKPLLRIQRLCGIRVIAEGGLNATGDKASSRWTTHAPRHVALQKRAPLAASWSMCGVEMSSHP